MAEPFTSVGCPLSRKARSETRVEKDMEVGGPRGSMLLVADATNRTGDLFGNAVKTVSKTGC